MWYVILGLVDTAVAGDRRDDVRLDWLDAVRRHGMNQSSHTPLTVGVPQHFVRLVEFERPEISLQKIWQYCQNDSHLQGNWLATFHGSTRKLAQGPHRQGQLTWRSLSIGDIIAERETLDDQWRYWVVSPVGFHECFPVDERLEIQGAYGLDWAV